MNAAVKSKRDAVIYLPGLFDSGKITVDAVAKRIAVAFDRNQANGKAKFGLTEGNEIEFEDTSKTRMITVQRCDPGSAAKPFIDVYEFDYRETLKENYRNHTPARQVVSIIWLLVSFFPRFMGSLAKAGKSRGEKFQIALAGTMLLVIALYLIMLIVTALATAVDSAEALRAPASVSTEITGTTNETTPTPDPNQEAEAGSEIMNFLATVDLLGWAQAVLVMFTALGLFTRQGIRQLIADAAVDFAAGLDYLSADRQKPTLIGQFAGLLETIVESDTSYDKVHVIGYSFGSIIALDCIFQTSAPTPRFERLKSLLTVGSPFDIIRTFWPHYFDARKRAPGKLKWINVFSYNDIMSSNFSDAADLAAMTPDIGICSESDKLMPTNLHFGDSATRQLNLFERLNRARNLHIEYWGGSDFAKSFLYQAVPDIWSGHDSLK